MELCGDNNDACVGEASLDGQEFVEVIRIMADFGEAETGIHCVSSLEATGG